MLTAIHSSIRSHYAGVVATLALFISLGGTSYAVISLPRSSVLAKHLAPSSVTSLKVRDGSLRARDFTAGALSMPQKGDQGIPGPPGPAGAKGDPGAAHTVRRHTAYLIGLGDFWRTTSCQSGERATGGGFQVLEGGFGANPNGVDIDRSEPLMMAGDSFPTGWLVGGYNTFSSTSLIVWVVCASP